MESSNGSGTLTPLIEGSGSRYVTTSQNFTITSATPPTDYNNDVKRGFGYTEGWLNWNISTYKIETRLPNLEGMDTTSMLQTNILLITVLVVCFVTLASVIALCACFLRRYCKNQRISQSSNQLCQTNLVSQATSVTGLNVAHVYYSTKVENKSDFYSSIVAPTKCEKAIACKSGSGRIVESCPSILAPNFELASPTCQTQTEEAAPIYFKMKNILTSTPAGGESQYMNDMGMQHGETLSPVSTASPPSLYTTALSNQQILTWNSQQFSPSDAGPTSNHIPVRCMTKGPLTQSISWFVPLDGIQHEPLRHSVVELKDDDVNVEHIIRHQGQVLRLPSQQCSRDGKSRAQPYQIGTPLNEEVENGVILTKTAMHPCDFQLQDLEDQVYSDAVEENVMLLNNIENMTPNHGVHSLPSQRSRLKSTISDDHISEDKMSYARARKTRSQSLSSPDENSMWRQREERPVLFLGSGIE